MKIIVNIYVGNILLQHWLQGGNLVYSSMQQQGEPNDKNLQ